MTCLDSVDAPDDETAAPSGACNPLPVALRPSLAAAWPLIVCRASGLAVVRIDCNAQVGLVGDLQELHGPRRRFDLYGLEDAGGWAMRLSSQPLPPSSAEAHEGAACILVDEAISSRLQLACRGRRRSHERWSSCLVGSTGREPSLHSDDPSDALNGSCVLHRHVAAYGARFAPRCDAIGERALGERAVGGRSVGERAGIGDARQASSALRGHLRPLGEQGQPRWDVEEVSGCEHPAAFLRRMAARRPLLMRDCAREQPGFHSWTDARLAALAGGWYGSAGYRERRLPLGTYLSAYRASSGGGPPYMARTNPPASLRSEVVLPTPARSSALVGAIENLVLWLSNGSQTSALHYDDGHFLLSQLDGAKRLTLVDPLDSAFLYADFAGVRARAQTSSPPRVRFHAASIANPSLPIHHAPSHIASSIPLLSPFSEPLL